MCLSTVYKVNTQGKEKICEYISKVDTTGNGFAFTDVMGEVTEVKGKLRSVDLVKNEILLEECETV